MSNEFYYLDENGKKSDRELFDLDDDDSYTPSYLKLLKDPKYSYLKKDFYYDNPERVKNDKNVKKNNKKK